MWERDIVITVDTNHAETPLYERARSMFIGRKCVEVRRARLDVADIVIERADGSFALFIERKTWSDLVSSINDGRQKEQKARLMKEVEERSARGQRAIMTYLIEAPSVPPVSAGPPDVSLRETDPAEAKHLQVNQRATQSLLMAMLRDNIPVHWYVEARAST